MSHENRYFIIESTNPNLNQIEEVIVGKIGTQRYSLDLSKLVIKLHKGDNNIYPFLDASEEYNHDEILETLNTSEWQQDIF